MTFAFLDDVSERGVRERRFDIAVDGRTVPGIVWTPADSPAGARGLVLVGHGYTLHKREGYVLSLARRLVRHHGVAAVAIDFPCHGDRASSDMWWTDQATDDTVAEWTAVLDAAQAQPDIGADVPVGYWGFSMGTIFGLPFVAEEARISVAVLGLMGIAGPTKDRIEKAARSLPADLPLLFVLQRDDELFSLPASIELFDAFATSDKRMHLNVGLHAGVPLDEFDYTEAFLARHLLAHTGS
ncbi:MAG TPA: alpha/beta fold hydrolase [Acidimicrobiales bacterium]